MEDQLSRDAYPQELGGPSALNNLEPKNKPWFLLMTARVAVGTTTTTTAATSTAKRKRNSPDNEEIRTNISKTQHPVEYLRMLNDEEGAHAEYTRLTVCDASNKKTTRLHKNKDLKCTFLEQVLWTGNTRKVLMQQLIEASSSILGAYDSNPSSAEASIKAEENDEEDYEDEETQQQQQHQQQQQSTKGRTRRRGRRAFRFEYATILCGTMDESMAEALRQKWKDRSRTVKSRAAIALAISEMYGLEIGLNEQLITGPLRYWEVTLKEGVINIESKTDASQHNVAVHKVPLIK